jgi:hypothetical protein
MLKPELMSPATIEDVQSINWEEQLSACRAARTALQRCCTALGHQELPSVVLSDVIMEDLQQYLGLEGSGYKPWWSREEGLGREEMQDRARKRLQCIAAVLGAVSGFTPRMGEMVFIFTKTLLDR